ncbi:hypothetical protein H5410_030723 [Solanum commersonii]|uniref:RNase H type-1 domain-containing protein n=1 Tax=Solanum commersonii TaxID=4109 RepID=A0A9J5YGJ0_SOLCO|nr:hypothetical protein H5410_030723 [Solanum commersonii]
MLENEGGWNSICGGNLEEENGWDYSTVREFFPDYVIDHVQTNLHPAYLSNQGDKAWRIETNNGKFTVKSAWDLLRYKKYTVEDMEKLWIKRVPSKISFLLGEFVLERYICCICSVEEPIEHLSFIRDFANIIWNRNLHATGIVGSMLNLKYFIRNIILHGGSFSEYKVFWSINDTISKFIQIKFTVQCNSTSWPYILSKLEQYRPRSSFRIVKWNPPPTNILKCNTDGASKGNPGPCLAAFCIRDCKDSLAIVHIIEGKWELPWSVVFEVSIIKRSRRDISAEHDFQFSHIQEIPSEGKKILNLEKVGTPYIRRHIQE